MSLVNSYFKQLRHEFNRIPAYLPGGRLQDLNLGDIISFDRNLWQKIWNRDINDNGFILGNISSFLQNLPPSLTSPNPQTIIYSSSGSTHVNIQANPGVGGELKLTFDAEESLYFLAQQAKEERYLLTDLSRHFRQISNISSRFIDNEDIYVVTGIYRAQKIFIALSREDNTELTLKVNGGNLSPFLGESGIIGEVGLMNFEVKSTNKAIFILNNGQGVPLFMSLGKISENGIAPVIRGYPNSYGESSLFSINRVEEISDKEILYPFNSIEPVGPINVDLPS